MVHLLSYNEIKDKEHEKICDILTEICIVFNK